MDPLFSVGNEGNFLIFAFLFYTCFLKNEVYKNAETQLLIKNEEHLKVTDFSPEKTLN